MAQTARTTQPTWSAHGSAAAGALAAAMPPAEVQRRMRAEFDRAKRLQVPLVYMLVGIDRVDRLEEVFGSGLIDEIFEVLQEELRARAGPEHVLAYIEGPTLFAQLSNTLPQSAVVISRTVIQESVSTVSARLGRAVRFALSIGWSHNQRKGDLAWDTVQRVAEEGLVVARAAGGGRAVHTELYRLFQAECAASAKSNVLRAPATERGAEMSSPEKHSWGAGEPEMETLDPESLERALVDLRRELEGVHQSDRDRYSREVDVLKRRIAKLTSLLGLTEEELRRVSEMKVVDPGVPSLYRAVQGLSDADRSYELKRKLMETIFEANVLLQRHAQMSATPADPASPQ